MTSNLAHYPTTVVAPSAYRLLCCADGPTLVRAWRSDKLETCQSAALAEHSTGNSLDTSSDEPFRPFLSQLSAPLAGAHRVRRQADRLQALQPRLCRRGTGRRRSGAARAGSRAQGGAVGWTAPVGPCCGNRPPAARAAGSGTPA